MEDTVLLTVLSKPYKLALGDVISALRVVIGVVVKKRVGRSRLIVDLGNDLSTLNTQLCVEILNVYLRAGLKSLTKLMN